MIDNDNTLHFLRESLVNTSEDAMTQQIITRLETHDYKNEQEFVKSLSEEETEYLDSVVEKELNYARNAEDDVRAQQLNDVYELLI
ncbi:sigma-G-dependent sporulation-specific acid-soluble spore protein CsgA [Lentibacillus halophilus]|uniref:Sigma-G-dependent sporulation-specific acid-soluble spore protein CsgA n=1 Tax=Lentibacillus halophilus TaxID=295065 RepID=A0ABN0Z9F3_9BACI